MKYIRAYLIAFIELFSAASAVYMVAASILYVFTQYRLSPLVGLYLLYLVVTASLGGVVKEWME